AGIFGAAAAALRGEIAGLAAANSLGKSTPPDRVRQLPGQAERASRFGRAMSELATPPRGMIAAMTPDTTICRCEGVRLAEIDAAIATGAYSLAELKAITRCGMGPCGGRVCEDTAAALIAARTGVAIETIGQGTARPPLRPVPLAPLSGSFDYAALPM